MGGVCEISRPQSDALSPPHLVRMLSIASTSSLRHSLPIDLLLLILSHYGYTPIRFFPRSLARQLHRRFPALLRSSSLVFFDPPTIPRFRHKIPLSPGASRRLGLVSLRIWFARQPHVRPTAGREAPPRDLISISSTEICSSQFRLRLYLGFVRDLISVSSEITSRLRHWLRRLFLARASDPLPQNEGAPQALPSTFPLPFQQTHRPSRAECGTGVSHPSLVGALLPLA